MPRSRGFTLIEVMITVAIVAILAAIAIPSYSEYVRRGRVAEAVSKLAAMRVKMEQHFQDNRSYTGACTSSSIAPVPEATSTFTFDCPGPPTGNQYTVRATGNGSMAGFVYTLNQDNVRATATGGPWPGNPACWVLRKDGSC